METSATEMPVFQDSDEHRYIYEMFNHHAVDETVIMMLQQFVADNSFGTTDDLDLSDNGQAAIAIEGSSVVFLNYISVLQIFKLTDTFRSPQTIFTSQKFMIISTHFLMLSLV